VITDRLGSSSDGDGGDGHKRTGIFIVGAGYVGLVTAVGMAGLGHQVTLADIDTAKIDRLREGHIPIFEPGLEEAMHEVADRLTFTTDLHPPAGVGYSFITVGTPLRDDGHLDLSNIENAIRKLLDEVAPDHVVVVRSTLPPGGPDAIQALRDDLADGPAVVTNPEFMREGSALRDFEQPGRILTGWLTEGDRPAAERVLELYAGIDVPTMVADARSVALVKIASNVFLAMKVAFANEIARLSDAYGANAPTVSDGIGLDDRIGRAFLDAGPGIGGSCLPEQAVALDAVARSVGVAAPLIGSVATANDVHQREIVRRLASFLGVDLEAEPGGLRGRKVALLGLAFKANTDDVRQSAALAIAAALRVAGATVVGTDPRAAAQAKRTDPDLEVVDRPEDAVAGADAVLVVTEWAEYRTLDWEGLAKGMRGDLVYDTRAVVDVAAIRAAGLRLERLGRPHRAAVPMGPGTDS
jgi:UDPglucose 6-dehydrogenase